METQGGEGRSRQGSRTLRHDRQGGYRDATPEGLDAAIEEINRRSEAWAVYSELEREQAKVHRLRKVCGKTPQPLEGLSQEEYSARLSEIFGLTDLVPDVDIEGDTAWMREQREKRGEPLPALPQ